MEGRDIGTVVFPEADVKIYLDAAAEERARRRAGDAAHSGGPAAVSDVATLLTERDRLDSTRAVSPLHAAPDAVVVDTTGKSIPEVVASVMAVVDQQGPPSVARKPRSLLVVGPSWVQFPRAVACSELYTDRNSSLSGTRSRPPLTISSTISGRRGVRRLVLLHR